MTKVAAAGKARMIDLGGWFTHQDGLPVRRWSPCSKVQKTVEGAVFYFTFNLCYDFPTTVFMFFNVLHGLPVL